MYESPLGLIEFAVLEAVHRGALRSRQSARQIASLRAEPAGEVILHDALHHLAQDGLVRGRRDQVGRRYELTAAGLVRLRADRRFRVALVGLLLRGEAARPTVAPRGSEQDASRPGP